MRRFQTPIVILVCAALVIFVSLGLRNSFGLFLSPISQDLGLPRETFAMAIALQNLTWGLSQPFFGMAADRYGAARVVVLGAVFYAGGLVVMAFAGGPLEMHLGIGLLIGLGLSGAGFAVVLGPVGRAYSPRKRSLALGIASAGGSVGQLSFAPVGQALINGFEWSGALLIFALAAALIVPFAAGLAGRPTTTAHDTEQGFGAALIEAGRHRGYWLLNGGFFVCGFHVTFIATHLPSYIGDHGLATMLGATALAVIGFFNIIGTLLAGFLGGHYRKKYLLSGLYLARAVAIGGFMLAPVSELSVLSFAAAIGLLWLGTVPLTSGLVAEIFGTRYLATLFGIVFCSHQIGAFFGAWLGGYMFDLTGSYDQVWLMAITLGLLAAILHWPIADKPMPRLLREEAPGRSGVRES